MSDFPRVDIERDGDVVVARVEGEVDISRVEALRAELLAALDNRDMALVVDLTGTSYLDSAGVNMLFELAEALGRRQIRLAVVVPEKGIVARVATLVSLESAVPVHGSADAALSALRDGPDSGD